ncbi:hypothetical protein [Sulfitobacter guttiformis]|uniref:DUF304 domain-containing protein n=1 Tax=Sulfitobacter guttiformis TaxID=74349 RepID=A0A420DNN3_9RHOB|nr:hypothetical protein [Sulfitobacter guttiformis]KIN73184.1 hypothetical protein Z949_2369 [Sulfitobacter guttiformis KCTC 32187]RKE95862.1 hypothetical protein C8N30_0406 [Sulfitobacter guttiformis]
MTPYEELPEFDPNEVLASAGASAGRRFLGLVSMGVLGLMLIYIAVVQSPALEWRLFLLVLGVGSLWLVDRMRRATSSRIELTETELRDSDGTVIALVADIDGLDRGFFAFKPSNGFLVRTTTKGANEWRPGMWWRAGRRIGVGGMMPAHQSKQIAEILAVIMAKREIENNR